MLKKTLPFSICAFFKVLKTRKECLLLESRAGAAHSCLYGAPTSCLRPVYVPSGPAFCHNRREVENTVFFAGFIKIAIQTSGRFSAWSANFWILSSQWVRSRRDLTHSTYVESCSSFFCKGKQRTHASLRGFAVNFENREITLPAGSRHQKKNGYRS